MANYIVAGGKTGRAKSPQHQTGPKWDMPWAMATMLEEAYPSEVDDAEVLSPEHPRVLDAVEQLRKRRRIRGKQSPGGSKRNADTSTGPETKRAKATRIEAENARLPQSESSPSTPDHKRKEEPSTGPWGEIFKRLNEHLPRIGAKLHTKGMIIREIQKLESDREIWGILVGRGSDQRQRSRTIWGFQSRCVAQNGFGTSVFRQDTKRHQWGALDQDS